ncbi:NADP-dependent oxidoreductase domain-containing protein 1 [Betta splendens]|uniref:NADP-dependent oxidoreductase domain-containing protein 1 n=1 Tax=Betta splendens TaxID=158456 RepID=A0A6P7LM97_BETSP|nr:NADP-dependent oxidoreductase domain-containing protein 1 [Betta splendens]
MDIASGLSSVSFESGLTEDEKKLAHLRARSAGLTFCGCAHAAYLCSLLHSLRCAISRHSAAEDAQLRVGILGMGHMGKQLLLSILEVVPIQPSNIKVSTRRPESAVEFAQMGVECFFDSGRLAAWADVLFLCCLPSHLPTACAGLRSHLPRRCLVSTFVSAVPVTRLNKLLGHDFVLKPEYSFTDGDAAGVWLPCTRVTAALRDPVLIEASCPLAASGGVSLGLTWVCAVLYSLLNVCTSAGVGSSDALSLVGGLFEDECKRSLHLIPQHFISSSCASSLATDKSFPWISLTDAQTKDTPLLRALSDNESMQRCICAAYKSLLTPGKLSSSDSKRPHAKLKHVNT